MLLPRVTDKEGKVNDNQVTETINLFTGSFQLDTDTGILKEYNFFFNI